MNNLTDLINKYVEGKKDIAPEKIDGTLQEKINQYFFKDLAENILNSFAKEYKTQFDLGDTVSVDPDSIVYGISWNEMFLGRNGVVMHLKTDRTRVDVNFGEKEGGWIDTSDLYIVKKANEHFKDEKIPEIKTFSDYDSWKKTALEHVKSYSVPLRNLSDIIKEEEKKRGLM